MKYQIAILAAVAIQSSAIAEWEYSKSVDKMTSRPISTAINTSDSSLNLTFPYHGTNYGFLAVRKHPSHGVDVIFQVQKGQILCSRVRGCTLTVRFDKKPPTKFEGSESDDYDHKLVFLQNAQKFIAEASKAQRILIGATLHDNGQQIVEFTSKKPLSWKP